MVVTKINCAHKEMTNQEQYEYIKKINKERPGVFMNADEWKRLTEIENRKRGRNWTI